MGSTPVSAPKDTYSNLYLIINLAHMVERLTSNLDVVGSNPTFYFMCLAIKDRQKESSQIRAVIEPPTARAV